MGTNPKRTVTVQMVPQLAKVDTLGNKEPDAKWVRQSNLNQSQVCPTSTLITSTDHKQDSLCTALTSNTANNQLPSKEGGPLSSMGSDVSVPANGNQNQAFGLASDKDGHAPNSSLTGRGVSKPEEGQRDDNANLRMLSPEEKHDISEAGLPSDVTASKVEIQTNHCRAKGPFPPVERCSEPMSTAKASPLGTGDNYTSCNNQRLGKGCESKPTASEGLTSLQESKDRILSTANTGVEVLQSKELDNINVICNSLDQSLVQKQCLMQISKPEKISPMLVETEQKTEDVLQPQPILGTTAVLSTTNSSLNNQEQSAAVVHQNSNSTHSETSLQPLNITQMTSDKHQSINTQRRSSTVPQAQENKPPDRDVADDANKTSTTAVIGQLKDQTKLHKEASTMTSLSSTPTKQYQDVEVQAVTNMCNKAVSTSPSLLPLTAVCRPSAGTLPQEEGLSLAVLYKADGGQGLHQMGPSQIYLDSIACPVEPRTERLTIEAELCTDQNAGLVLHTEAGSLHQVSDQAGIKSKLHSSTACYGQTGPPLKPVYQINIEHSAQREQVAGVAQPPVSSQSMLKAEELPPSDTPTLPVETSKTPTSEASTSQPSLETLSVIKPKYAENQPQSDLTTKSNQAASTSIPTKSESKSNTSKSDSKSLKDTIKPAGKPLAKETSADKQGLEPERKKEEEEEEEESDKQQGKGIHEVVWDEQGMTWEVYGAAVDPESLGFAIQSHLQCKIKEQERKLFAKSSQRKSVATGDSPRQEMKKTKKKKKKKKQRRPNIFRSMLKNVRRPNCCSRPSAASVLE